MCSSVKLILPPPLPPSGCVLVGICKRLSTEVLRVVTSSVLLQLPPVCPVTSNNNLFSNKRSSLTILDAPLIAIKLIWVGQDKTQAILNTYYKEKRNTIKGRKKHWKFSQQLYVISLNVKYRYWNLLCLLWYVSWCTFLFLVSESFCWSIDLEWAWVKFALFLANTFFSSLLHLITTSAPRLLIIQEDTFFFFFIQMRI